MDRTTGKQLSDFEHLKQSIIDILTTPLGSRVEQRDYGCGLFQMVDRNIDKAFVMWAYVSIAEAITKWEPRILLSKITLDATQWRDGILLLDLEGWYLIQGEPIRVNNLYLDFYGSKQPQ